MNAAMNRLAGRHLQARAGCLLLGREALTSRAWELRDPVTPPQDLCRL